MNEMEPCQKVEYGVTKKQGAPKDVPLELPEDDSSNSPIFSEEDKDEDDLVLFDLQQPMDSDREGRWAYRSYATVLNSTNHLIRTYGHTLCSCVKVHRTGSLGLVRHR